jgi:hypothetical protein
LRPKRSATKPNSAAPRNSPKNNAATKLATPPDVAKVATKLKTLSVSNRPGGVGDNTPLRTRAGAI